MRDLMRERLDLKEPPNSPLETVIWELLFGSGLPLPVPQFEIRDRQGVFVARVDFAYPQQRLVIEGHSKTWHWGMQAHSDDARRHNAIANEGFQIVYVTWSDATERADSTVRLLENLLNYASTGAP